MLNDGPLKVKTTDFAVRIVKLGQYLMNEKKEYILSKQIVRSGTNPGAMVREVASAESGKDFVHKLTIALKEIDETQYWLELLFKTGYMNEIEFDSMTNDAKEIARILTKSILTKKKNLN